MLFQSCRPARLSPQRCSRAPAERVRQLAAVVVADHVVGEDDESLAREVDGAARPRDQRVVLEAAVRPVPVRRQHRGKRAVTVRPVEVAGDEESGQALEVHLRDAIARVLALVEDDRIQRRLRRQRQQARGREHVLAKPRRRAQSHSARDVKAGAGNRSSSVGYWAPAAAGKMAERRQWLGLRRACAEGITGGDADRLFQAGCPCPCGVPRCNPP